MTNVLLMLAAVIGALFPPFFCRFLARRAAEIRYLLYPRMRRTVRSNLRVVLAHRAARRGIPFDERSLTKTVRAVYYTFALYLTDFYTSRRITRRFIRRHVRVEGTALLDAGLARGRGVVALTAHLGNYELAGMAAAMLGYPVAAVALPYRNRRIVGIFNRLREARGVQVILTGVSARRIARALRENRVVAFLGDRLFGDRGVAVEFMGRTTLLPRGPATFAVKLGAAMVAGFLVYEKAGRRFFFEPVPAAPADMDDEEKVEWITARCARILEERILDHPEQWLAFAPLW